MKRRPYRSRAETGGRHPRFFGNLESPTNKYLVNLGADGIEILMRPWAEQVYKAPGE